jgi:hypothetical protein
MSGNVLKFPNLKELKRTIRISAPGPDAFLHITFNDPAEAAKTLERGGYASVGNAELHVGGHPVVSYAIERMAPFHPLFHVTGPLEEGRPIYGEQYTVAINDLSFPVSAEEAGRLIDSGLFDAYDEDED